MWTRRGRAAAKAVRSDADRIAEIAVGKGEPVGDVLREVADFRLALETDFLIAAAAAEAGEAGIVAEVVDGERAELVSFQDRLLDRLADAAAVEQARSRSAAPRGVGRTRLVGAAAAMLAIVGGGFVTQQDRPVSPANVAFAEADQELTILAEMTELDASPAAVEQAAEELHETIESLIAEHGDDPHYAFRIAELIEREQELLERNPLPSHRKVVSEVNRLAVRLVRKAPAGVRNSLPPMTVVVTPPPSKPSPSPKPSASPATSSKPSPKPSPSSTSPRPSSSSSSNQNDSGLPAGP